MITRPLGGVLTKEEIQQFREEGFYVAKGLFKEEVEQLRNHFMQMHAAGPIKGYFHPLTAEEANGDILKQYPRIMHPHRFDDLSMQYMIDPRVMNILADLYGEEPLAAQSMFYFKPPGAKGQALHQDNFYLKVEPGTCIAAWTAVDGADEENGGLFVVPKSNMLDIQCPHRADPAVSFTREEVDVPEGLQAVPVIMEAGDVLFFNGSAIHGSYPNTSADRFRRAFICHYANASATKISGHYKPMYHADGAVVQGMEDNHDGGPCGTEYAVGIH
ncbi:phytanoyl-CoA dioxygenase family protein [Paenibacillus cremeus]|uniref:Phytanoyl-CoA dioxygenase family protein n=1 Tax=Paenibacillus cremeus TaxID=2163881 RepID=A0A559K8J7_9BACL|nr:phytanoyl-CoA dioxygenase family protein [Paenibacillus cremeus]TVY08460.1 phytanoyl-CoA dioxygenase family protein [Paenibacillus cremeus]